MSCVRVAAPARLHHTVSISVVIDEVVLEQAISEPSRCWLTAGEKRRATVAVDATGLTPGAISTFSIERAKDREPGFTRSHWVRWPMANDVDSGPIVAQANYEHCQSLTLSCHGLIQMLKNFPLLQDDNTVLTPGRTCRRFEISPHAISVA